MAFAVKLGKFLGLSFYAQFLLERWQSVFIYFFDLLVN